MKTIDTVIISKFSIQKVNHSNKCQNKYYSHRNANNYHLLAIKFFIRNNLTALRAADIFLFIFSNIFKLIATF